MSCSVHLQFLKWWISYFWITYPNLKAFIIYLFLSYPDPNGVLFCAGLDTNRIYVITNCNRIDRVDSFFIRFRTFLNYLDQKIKTALFEGGGWSADR